MNFRGIELCCPACAGELHDDGVSTQSLHCRSCGRAYPVVLGIPDLRLTDDPYIERSADVEKGKRIAERLADLDFAGLVEHYYGMTAAVPKSDAIRYARGLQAAPARARGSLEVWDSAGPPLRGGRFLDVGCGTAPLIVAARGRFDAMCGVDIAFRWLVIGSKRLQEAGIDAPLICASAEHLPFAPGQFDIAAGESFLENVQDQSRTLAQIRRVLRPAGRFALSTPNRFSLGPDPHVGIWAGGYLPDRVIARHVLRKGGVPPRRRLLSAMDLRRMLPGSGFESVRVLLPEVPEEQRRQLVPSQARLVGVYNALKWLPVARQLLFLFGPLLHAVAETPAAGEPGAAPAAVQWSKRHGEHAAIG